MDNFSVGLYLLFALEHGRGRCHGLDSETVAFRDLRGQGLQVGPREGAVPEEPGLAFVSGEKVVHGIVYVDFYVFGRSQHWVVGVEFYREDKVQCECPVVYGDDYCFRSHVDSLRSLTFGLLSSVLIVTVTPVS